MIQNEPITSLPRTSSVTFHKLEEIGIKTYFDLVNYFPFRYENYSLISPINNLQHGETVTIKGEIINSKYQITRSGLRIQVFTLADQSGQIQIGFYNQPFLLRILKRGIVASFSGIVEKFGNKLSLLPKSYELGDTYIHTGRIIPIYQEKKGLSSRTLREKIYTVFNQLKQDKDWNNTDFFPNEIIDFNGLIKQNNAYLQIHFPDSEKDAEKARERLSFDELFLIQFASKMVKDSWAKIKVEKKFKTDVEKEKSIEKFISNLPFKLTDSQNKVWGEVFHDLNKENPMNRFLQGEVGSGKTVIAALAGYFSYLNNRQTLVMAPTEILAQQHFNTLTKLFGKLNKKETPGISLVTSNKKLISVKTTESNKVNKKKNKPNSKNEVLDANIIVGTHSLINKNLNFEKVGLVVVDEQQRFGVAQRAELKNKGSNPHLLTMTATPIPRTVALTIYGELDLSIIDQMPLGRLKIKSYYVPKMKRAAGYQWIKNQIRKFKSQAYVVCPIIEESEIETMKSVKAAKKEFESLKAIFSDFNLGLLHGKMKTDEKDKIMKDFQENRINILVSTSVVEVGIDVPNATIMLIEGGERFGLAQLHQLRGRVGRSDKQSYCFVYTENENTDIIKRLEFFTSNENGNKLAEYDLKLRGPGDLYGIRQHGYFNLKIASLSDYQMITKTKNAVLYFSKHFQINDYPDLKKRMEFFKTTSIAKD